MTRFPAALVAAALLLPAGALAQGAQTQGCTPGTVWLDGKCAAVLSDILPIPPPDHSYHLLTISNGGTVSLIKDLTKRECDEVARKLWHTAWSTLQPGDIKSAECFQ